MKVNLTENEKIILKIIGMLLFFISFVFIMFISCHNILISLTK